MRNKTSRNLLDHSCAWIREHWDAQNLDVPDELLDRWIYQNNEDEEEPTGFYLAVFSFGYLQHDLLASRVPAGVKRSVPVTQIFELFGAWQLKLALAQIHRVTDLRVRPMPLFAFPAEEQVEAWHEAVSNAPQMPTS